MDETSTSAGAASTHTVAVPPPPLSDPAEIELGTGGPSASEGICVDAAFDRLRELALGQRETSTAKEKGVRLEVLEGPEER